MSLCATDRRRRRLGAGAGREGPAPGGSGGGHARRGQPADRHLVGVGGRRPSALHDRRDRTLDRRIRRRGRAVPGRELTRAGRGRLGRRSQRAPEVGRRGRLRDLVRGAGGAAGEHRPGRGRGGGGGRPGRQGTPHGASRRHDRGRLEARRPRPGLRRASRARHHRRHDRSGSRVRRPVLGPRRVRRRDGGLPGLRRPRPRPAGAAGLRAAAAGAVPDGGPTGTVPLAHPAEPPVAAAPRGRGGLGCSRSATASSISRCSTAASSP